MSETAVVAAPVVDAPVTPETPAVPQAPAKPASKERMFDVVVDGKKEQWPESKVLERAQKGTAAEMRMAEASKLELAFNNFVAQSQDPQKLLDLLNNPKALGYDETKQVALVNAMLKAKNPAILKAVKQWIYENEVEPSTLTPEQKKMRELEAFKADAEDRETKRKLEDEEAKKKTETDRFFNEYRKKIWEGIQAEKLPQTELMVARITRKVQLMRQRGMPGDVAKACALVKQDLGLEYAEQLTKIPDDQILDFLPPGVAERINKAFIARLKGPEAEGGSKGQPRAKSEKKGPSLAEQLKQVSRGRRAF